jgi:hypothetical protein
MTSKRPIDDLLAAHADTTKTHERKMYERQLQVTEQSLVAARKELQGLIDGAASWGLVITIECIPQIPLHMGNVKMVGAARASRERQNELEALRLAAEKSERQP